jgi:uncharacterized protein (DUF2164 family)
MSRRASSEVVVIMWRDIPAQINGKVGADRHQVILPHRFQKAIDRAAMVAEKKTAQEYVGEWRRTSYPLTGELAATIDAIAASIEVEFTNERLHALVDNGGWDPATAAVAAADSSTLPNDTAPHHTGTGDQPS